MIYREQVHENGLLFTEKKGIPLFTFPLFDRTGLVHAAFSTRMGGVSENEFATMNFTSSRGDDPQKTRENFRRFLAAMDVNPNRLVFSRQTHTTNVRVVTEADAGKGFLTETDYEDVDGLITDVPGLVLATFYADCIPLLFLDPVRKVVATSHSGWRGTLAGMGEVTVRKMTETFGCRREDILAAIGPGICRDCYEVGDELYDAFREKWTTEEVQRIFVRKPGEKWHLDLWEANVLVLKRAGITEDHLAVTNVCTCCNSKELFSHRASHGKRGNLGAFISLKAET
ncbi:MAG: peptidoglycan editing factor PgeF [Lachnospiraceae bacterium]|nr:peptidoglycan editing factor PgeF [Lachnospiraceae bacterium]